MSQPPTYNPATDFTSYQTNNPGQPMSGASLDTEFNSLKTTLDAIKVNMALLQRDDTALHNAIVHPDSFTTASLALIAATWTPQGAWVTLTAYAVGDVIESGNTGYVCGVAHTAGTFATDYASGYWVTLGASLANLQSGTSLFAIAGGTVDVITATFTPTITTLDDGMQIRVRAAGANTVAGVTVNVDGIGAKTVKRYGNQALVLGDIPRIDYEMMLRYNLSNDVWELLNPYTMGFSTLGTVTATTSGTSHEYTSIPPWVKKIIISIGGVSSSGTSPYIIQIGDASAYKTASYYGSSGYVTSTAQGAALMTSGFQFVSAIAAGTIIHGIAVLSLINSSTNEWGFTFTGGQSDTAAVIFGGGTAILTSALTRLKLTTIAGIDTFDAGSFNILYE